MSVSFREAIFKLDNNEWKRITNLYCLSYNQYLERVSDEASDICYRLCEGDGLHKKVLGSFSSDCFSLISVLEGWFEYITPTLDEKEIKYLKYVIRPFRDKVKHIIKDSRNNYESICIEYWDEFNRRLEYLNLPPFVKGLMYKNMDSGKVYTMEELGLKKKGE